jgi:VWFA-related protein
MSRRALTPLLLSLLVIPQSLAQNAQNAPVLTLRPVVREVQLDVIVTDSKGHPVKGLKSSDFTLLEDGSPQRFNHFEEHSSMTSEQIAKLAPPEKAPPNTFTNYVSAVNTNASTVILLDALDTPIQAQQYIRNQVIDYMKQVPPGASIAIFSLDTRMSLVQGFTSDPEVLLNAVKSHRDDPKISLLLDGHNEVYRQFRLDELTQGMRMLSRYLAGFPGRKNLIWFTGSVPRSMYDTGGIGNPFPDASTFLDDYAKTTDELTLSRVAVYPIDGRGLATDPAFSAANRAGPTPRSANEFATRQFFDHSDLDLVADATGGKAYYNTNGLKNVIADIVDAGSNYYSIAYTPTNTKWDGQFRKIKVQTDTSGLSLQYRNGYRAQSREQIESTHAANIQKRQAAGQFVPSSEPQPKDPRVALVRRAPQENMKASMQLGAIPPTQVIFNASLTAGANITKLDKNAPLPKDNYLAPEFRTKPFRDYHILYAFSPHNIVFTATPDGLHHGRVEFVAVLFNQQGEAVNSMVTNSEMDLKDATYRRLMQGRAMSINQTIAVPVKGNYFLRLGVHDATADHVGAIEIPVDEIKPGIAGAGQTLTPATGPASPPASSPRPSTPAVFPPAAQSSTPPPAPP